MKKNRIRLTESQLHRVIKESVNEVLNEKQGFMDGIKGAWNGMTQGFNKGQQQMQSDTYRNNRNESNSLDLTRYAMQAYETLVNCSHQDARQMSLAIRDAASDLMYGLKNAGFNGFSDGSGTDWKNNYKQLYNKHNGYNGNVNPSYQND